MDGTTSMPALVAMRFNPGLKRVYSRPVDSGKLAINVVTPKLVILANVLLPDDLIWDPKGRLIPTDTLALRR